MKKVLLAFAVAGCVLLIAGCDSGDYKTGGGGHPQHYNTGNGQYD